MKGVAAIANGAPDDRALRTVLIVVDDESRARELALMFGDIGLHAATTASVEAARAELKKQPYDALVCDVGWLEELADAGPLIIATAGPGRREDALAAIDAGAFDCLVEPHEPLRVAVTMHRAERHARSAEGARRAELPVPVESFGGMVGASEPMRDVFRMVDKVAAHKATVLITGESGTGKELVARAIHDRGPRARGRFVAINCGAIPANLLESELFGHKRGAFTDAVRDKTGLFEEASGGTLFLDEIGELPLELQPKILRAIQEEEIRPIGGNQTTQIDVRLIAATLRDLALDVRNGRFREDLFYRLNVLPVSLPPLRERPEDVPALVEHFIRRHGERYASASHIEGVTPRAMRALQRYSWPGNIRELENAIERAMVLCDGHLVDVELLDDKIRQITDEDVPMQRVLSSGELSIKKTTRLIEEELIRRALEATGGNRTNAAKLLEISHRALLYKIKEYGI